MVIAGSSSFTVLLELHGEVLETEARWMHGQTYSKLNSRQPTSI